MRVHQLPFLRPSTLAGFALGLAAPAAGQDLYGPAPSVIDTEAEAKVYEELPDAAPPRGVPPIERILPDGTRVRLYGHINWGVLNYADGRETHTYAPIDNANSASRLGLLVGRTLADWELGGRVEVQYAPYSTADVSVLDDSADFGVDQGNIRWIEVTAEQERYGRFALGQGSMATDGITLIDFADTNVIAYSSVGDSAGGQFLRYADPTRPLDEAPRIRQAFANFDGPRRVRIRYDTPSLRGFSAAAAYGRELITTRDHVREDDLFDLSATYGEAIGDFQLGAGLGYFWDRDDREILSGSASVLHLPTGLNLTIASATLDIDRNHPQYWYVKGGIRRDIFACGATAFSFDHYAGDDIVRDGSASTSYGVAVVQRIDAVNTEVWATFRVYAYDEPASDFEDAGASYAGLRLRF